ncbi:MAG: hypothetical protein RJQ00_09455 [Vicingaceae bacterium]
MTKLEIEIKKYIDRKKTEKVELPVWDIQFYQNSGSREMDISLSVKNNFQFQYKYHSLLDVCDSGIYFKSDDGLDCSISFMLNVFVDLLNGGVKEFKIAPEMHGLSAFSNKKRKGINGLVQVFDRDNEKCLFTKKIQNFTEMI